MTAFMGLLMFGFGLSSIICLIWLVFRLIKKRPFKRQSLYCLSCFIAAIIAAIAMDASMTPEEKAALAEQRAQKQAIEIAEKEAAERATVEKEISRRTTVTETVLTQIPPLETSSNDVIQDQPTISPSTNNIAIDDLQRLYLKISNTMTYDEILEIAKISNLPFAEHKYADSQHIKMVFNKEVLPDKHAPSGDYLVVVFNKSKTKINFIEYNNHKAFKTLVELLDGHYWELNGKEHAGLYGYIPGKSKNIFTSKEDQLNYINNSN